MFDGIGKAIWDMLQSFFWGIAKPLLMLINTLLDSLFNGVLNLNIFTENQFLSTAFTCSLALMFLILPAKFIYEIVTSLIKDDDAGLDLRKKMGSALMGIVIACSLTVVVTKVVNPMVRDITGVMMGINLVTENEKGTSQVGDALIETILVSFGGMPQEGEYGARSFVQKWNNDPNSIDITERYDSDIKDSSGNIIHHKDDYKWNTSLVMSIVGFVIYVIMLFVVTIQIAMRMIAIGFYYIIGPLCCTSLTNYQNPQMFVVWKNTMIGAWAQNIAQIFILSFLVSCIDAITRASSSYPIATLALYFGAYSLTITVPAIIQSMIGGYSAGMMDIINTARSGFGMASSIVGGAIGATMGRRSPSTGHLQGGMRGAIAGDKLADGRRQGGMRGAIAGNQQSDGTRQGGIKGTVMGREMNMNGIKGYSGGLRGAVMGNDNLQADVDRGVQKTRQGGVMGMVKGGSTTTRFNRQGQKIADIRSPRMSSLRGSTVTPYSTEKGSMGQAGTPYHSPSKTQSNLSNLNNRTQQRQRGR